MEQLLTAENNANSTTVVMNNMTYPELKEASLGSMNLTNGSAFNVTQALQNLEFHILYTDKNLDDFFYVVNGLIVVLMQTGFACLEAGSVRSKNVTNIMLKNFLDTFVCSVVFWVVGFGLAFGDGNAFLGLGWFFTYNMPEQYWSEWFFQFTFASTASTILSGAMAERCSFITYLLYSALMSGVIYPICIHWAWTDQGWLSPLGFKDFAGGMLVHGLAGCACLVSAILVGPRIGRFSKDSENTIMGHSTALIGAGGIILIVGFCGFNAGTLNHFSHPGDGTLVAIICRNTIMCGAGAVFVILFAGKLGIFGDSFWPFTLTINGGIAGLVSSCAGCDQFSPLESIITGAIGGVIFMSMRGIIIALKIDDPLDSSPIHMGAGIWSVLSIPLVAKGGIISNPINGVLHKLVVQLEGAGAVALWSFIMSFILFGSLKMFGLLRSTREEEIVGNDITKHNEPAYSEWDSYRSRSKSLI